MKKLWTIRLNARYEVVPCVFQEKQEDTSFYRIGFKYDGKRDFVVTDIKDEDIFESRKAAIIECIRRCREMARSWTEHADSLACGESVAEKNNEQKSL